MAEPGVGSRPRARLHRWGHHDRCHALNLSVVVMREGPADAVAVERLAERAFGPGRFARTAYRLREAADPDWDLCFVARVSTLLVGSNRMTPVHAGTAPAFMLGPITVDPAFRGRGIAASLMTQSLDAAREAGHGLVILVGDEPYYRRFGFTRVPPGRLKLPGPVDPARFLWFDLVPGPPPGAAHRDMAGRSSLPSIPGVAVSDPQRERARLKRHRPQGSARP